MFQRLIEATLSQLGNKQKSITRLFPDFFSNPVKVPGVISKGGVRLGNISQDVWTFRVHSGTEEDLWYDVTLRWKDLKKELEKLVSDRRNWTKDKKKADLRKVAAKLFKSGNVELECSCPADLYWGKHYIRSQDKYKAKYGEPETRPPEVRNPKLYGAYCKHIQVLMRTLPFYKASIATWLGKEFRDVVAGAEEAAIQTTKRYQAAGQALAKRVARESIQESLTALPKEQQDLIKKTKIPLGKLIRSDYSDEPWFKFWIMNDGSVVPVVSDHSELLDLPSDHTKLLKSGAVRGHINDGERHTEISIHVRKDPSDLQIAALERLAYQYHVDNFILDSWRISGDDYSGPIKKPEEIGFIIQYGSKGMEESKRHVDLRAIRTDVAEFFKNAVSRIVSECKLGTKIFSENSYLLLPDGNAVITTDSKISPGPGEISASMLERYGCFHVQKDDFFKRMSVCGSRPLNEKQIAWLKKLFLANNSILVEAESTKKSEWDEFGPSHPKQLIEELIKFFGENHVK